MIDPSWRMTASQMSLGEAKSHQVDQYRVHLVMDTPFAIPAVVNFTIVHHLHP